MGKTRISQRLAEAARQLAALQARSVTNAEASPLLAETLDAYAATLRDLEDLEKEAPSANIDIHEAPSNSGTGTNQLSTSDPTPSMPNERDWVQSFIDNLSIAFAYLDKEFHFIFVNQAFVEYSGYTREKLIGAHFFDLYPRSENRVVFENVLATGVGVQFNTRPYIVPDHQERGILYYNWSVAPFRRRGEIQGLVISSQDVTAEELATQEREQHLLAHKSLVDLSKQVLTQKYPEEVLRCVAEGARSLTKARVGIARYSFYQDRPDINASSTAGEIQSPPEGDWFQGTNQMVYDRLRDKQDTLHLSLDELRQSLARRELPDNSFPFNSILAASLTDMNGLIKGFVAVYYKSEDEFRLEHEGLINQLAAIASLGLQHLKARSIAEQRAYELKTLIDSLSDGVVVCDTNGVTLSANPAAIRFFGPEVEALERAEFANKLAFRHEDDRLYTPQDLPVYRALGGEIVQDQIIVLTDPQGERRVVLTAASPLYEGDRIIGAVTIWHDITEREATRQELVRERGRLSAIIQSAPEGIVVTDESERVVLTNPAAVRFYGQDVEYGLDLLSQLHLHFTYPNGQSIDRADLPLSTALAGGRVGHDFEMGVTWPDGQQRTLLVNSAPILDSQQHSDGAVLIFQDITKRRRISNALKQRVHDLRMLNRLSRDLSATLEQQKIVQRMLEAVHNLVAETVSCLWLWDQERQGWLLCEGCVGTKWEHEPLGQRLHPEEGFWSQILHKHGGVIFNDVSALPELANYTNGWIGSQTGSVLGMPLSVGDRVLGVMLVASDKVARFKGYERLLLETLASTAASALENARLLGETQRTAAAAERSRLARELHDAISQSLFSASIIAETLPRLWERDPASLKPGLEQLKLLTRSSLAEMRSLLLELRPSALLETSLAELIKQLGETMAGRMHLDVELDLDSACVAPPDTHIGFYRIAQESLHNIAKHSRASQVLVSLRQRQAVLELRVRDNGRGFDPQLIKPGHFGLSIMRERAEALGLDYDINSQVGVGTEIVVRYSRKEGKEHAE